MRPWRQTACFVGCLHRHAIEGVALAGVSRNQCLRDSTRAPRARRNAQRSRRNRHPIRKGLRDSPVSWCHPKGWRIRPTCRVTSS